LDQLRARARHEIAAHADDLDKTDTGRYFMGEASELLAALRLWALSQYRTDQAIRLTHVSVTSGSPKSPGVGVVDP
jgi:hypothetical protein